ncbi:hypothetical protein GX50_00992 [[Emmonsia] crescens]|uniref:Uncharacterized protein n=1 Tax=[Emmonsia] crescens TaxID=73230 RepID=A0A2B7ZTP7_9EURO|nr:hypothetical protein GX50_00992 [Emmonsia crescens]
MSYLRILYQIATRPHPRNSDSDGRRPKPDGGTARTAKAWELSRRDGLGLSRGKEGDVKIVWKGRGKRKAGGGKVTIAGGGGTGRVEESNASRVDRGRSSLAEHAVVEGCMCTYCKRRREGGGGGGGGGADNGVVRRVRFDLSR